MKKQTKTELLTKKKQRKNQNQNKTNDHINLYWNNF